MFLNPFPVTHPIHDDRERIKEPVAAGKTKGMKGRFELLKWDIKNRPKTGVKSETLSRYSATYFDQDANNQVMGYPVALLGFLKPYIKARF